STTITDEDGHFRLKTQKQQGHLTVMMMGFKTREVPFGPRHRPLKIYLEKNKVSLNEVLITSYNSGKLNKDTPGAIASIDENRIHQGSGTSLQAAFNSIPGVEMDQSSLSDSRVSIRGNGIRSPWGIRDIKVYVNGIPLTETDGTTRLEALDVADLHSAEIIKGPASSIYGGG